MQRRNSHARADIYSLGCSLYYLLTGKATYDGDTLMAKLLAHRDEPIPSIRAIRPDVPDRFQAVFNRMVAKRVEDRYQTMSEWSTCAVKGSFIEFDAVLRFHVRRPLTAVFPTLAE